jgi:hypothetical protein
MRIASLLIAVLLTSVVLAGCSQKSGQTSTNSTTATEAATEAAAVNVKVPLYPGASVKHFTSSSSAGGVTTTTYQTALQTPDAFDKVYAWYKSKLTGWNDTGGVRSTTNSAGTQKNGAFRSGGDANATVVGITSVDTGTWVSILEKTPPK